MDIAMGVAADSAGNAYVTGFTGSAASDNFPVTVGPQTSVRPQDAALYAFVAKVKSDGSGLDYCGYIAGAGLQAGTAIAVDSSGNAYVTGYTNSDQSSFPVTVGPSLKYGGDLGGDDVGDAFVAKISPDGTHLVYCGYIGGQGDDGGYGIAVDSSGNAYVTGETTSPGPSQHGATVPFPASIGPSLANAGGRDAFIAKVKADGTGLAYCGFIGGTGDDRGLGVAVDSNGSAYVTGATKSPAQGFDTLTVGPSLVPGGQFDAFVAKVKPDGSGFLYCGYIGGDANDSGAGIAVDSAGNAYVTGGTGSTEATFPVKGGPKLTYGGGDSSFGDAFIAKVNPTGSGLVYCGYIGGSAGDVGFHVALDSSGSAYIVGGTSSSDLPVTDGSKFHGGTQLGDAFIARVSADGASLLFAAYFGGSADEAGTGIALDGQGNIIICGGTYSTQSTFPVMVGPSQTFNLENQGIFGILFPEAFVAKLAALSPPPPPAPDFSLSSNPVTSTTSPGSKLNIDIAITRTGGLSGPVTVSPPDSLPGGVKIPTGAVSTSGDTAGFTIKVKGKARAGSYPLTFTGVDTANQTHTATFTLVVQ
jgi:hypothetical protein